MTRAEAETRFGHPPTFGEVIEQAVDYGAVEAWCEPRPGWAPFVLLRFEIWEPLLERTRGAWICVIAPEVS